MQLSHQLLKVNHYISPIPHLAARQMEKTTIKGIRPELSADTIHGHEKDTKMTKNSWKYKPVGTKQTTDEMNQKERSAGVLDPEERLSREHPQNKEGTEEDVSLSSDLLYCLVNGHWRQVDPSIPSPRSSVIFNRCSQEMSTTANLTYGSTTELLIRNDRDESARELPNSLMDSLIKSNNIYGNNDQNIPTDVNDNVTCTSANATVNSPIFNDYSNVPAGTIDTPSELSIPHNTVMLSSSDIRGTVDRSLTSTVEGTYSFTSINKNKSQSGNGLTRGVSLAINEGIEVDSSNVNEVKLSSHSASGTNSEIHDPADDLVNITDIKFTDTPRAISTQTKTDKKDTSDPPEISSIPDIGQPVDPLPVESPTPSDSNNYSTVFAIANASMKDPPSPSAATTTIATLEVDSKRENEFEIGLCYVGEVTAAVTRMMGWTEDHLHLVSQKTLLRPTAKVDVDVSSLQIRDLHPEAMPEDCRWTFCRLQVISPSTESERGDASTATPIGCDVNFTAPVVSAPTGGASCFVTGLCADTGAPRWEESNLVPIKNVLTDSLKVEIWRKYPRPVKKTTLEKLVRGSFRSSKEKTEQDKEELEQTKEKKTEPSKENQNQNQENMDYLIEKVSHIREPLLRRPSGELEVLRESDPPNVVDTYDTLSLISERRLALGSFISSSSHLIKKRFGSLRKKVSPLKKKSGFGSSTSFDEFDTGSRESLDSIFERMKSLKKKKPKAANSSNTKEKGSERTEVRLSGVLNETRNTDISENRNNQNPFADDEKILSPNNPFYLGNEEEELEEDLSPTNPFRKDLQEDEADSSNPFFEKESLTPSDPESPENEDVDLSLDLNPVLCKEEALTYEANNWPMTRSTPCTPRKDESFPNTDSSLPSGVNSRPMARSTPCTPRKEDSFPNRGSLLSNSVGSSPKLMETRKGFRLSSLRIKKQDSSSSLGTRSLFEVPSEVDGSQEKPKTGKKGSFGMFAPNFKKLIGKKDKSKETSFPSSKETKIIDVVDSSESVRNLSPIPSNSLRSDLSSTGEDLPSSPSALGPSVTQPKAKRSLSPELAPTATATLMTTPTCPPSGAPTHPAKGQHQDSLRRQKPDDILGIVIIPLKDLLKSGRLSSSYAIITASTLEEPSHCPLPTPSSTLNPPENDSPRKCGMLRIVLRLSVWSDLVTTARRSYQAALNGMTAHSLKVMSHLHLPYELPPAFRCLLAQLQYLSQLREEQRALAQLLVALHHPRVEPASLLQFLMYGKVFLEDGLYSQQERGELKCALMAWADDRVRAVHHLHSTFPPAALDRLEITLRCLAILDQDEVLGEATRGPSNSVEGSAEPHADADVNELPEGAAGEPEAYPGICHRVIAAVTAHCEEWLDAWHNEPGSPTSSQPTSGTFTPEQTDTEMERMSVLLAPMVDFLVLVDQVYSPVIKRTMDFDYLDLVYPKLIDGVLADLKVPGVIEVTDVTSKSREELQSSIALLWTILTHLSSINRLGLSHQLPSRNWPSTYHEVFHALVLRWALFSRCYVNQLFLEQIDEDDLEAISDLKIYSSSAEEAADTIRAVWNRHGELCWVSQVMRRQAWAVLSRHLATSSAHYAHALVDVFASRTENDVFSAVQVCLVLQNIERVKDEALAITKSFSTSNTDEVIQKDFSEYDEEKREFLKKVIMKRFPDLERQLDTALARSNAHEVTENLAAWLDPLRHGPHLGILGAQDLVISLLGRMYLWLQQKIEERSLRNRAKDFWQLYVVMKGVMDFFDRLARGGFFSLSVEETQMFQVALDHVHRKGTLTVELMSQYYGQRLLEQQSLAFLDAPALVVNARFLKGQHRLQVEVLQSPGVPGAGEVYVQVALVPAPWFGLRSKKKTNVSLEDPAVFAVTLQFSTKGYSPDALNRGFILFTLKSRRRARSTYHLEALMALATVPLVQPSGPQPGLPNTYLPLTRPQSSHEYKALAVLKSRTSDGKAIGFVKDLQRRAEAQFEENDRES
ncbi:uncharacterized protein LOC143039393 [Oratosquilla oratoria]|uniref:uncharacterized protein LOC143039393 n=1 Tax=Oratosquilla oratoria TaxID=337810 RepID=UPI003F76968D